MRTDEEREQDRGQDVLGVDNQICSLAKELCKTIDDFREETSRGLVKLYSELAILTESINELVDREKPKL